MDVAVDDTDTALVERHHAVSTSFGELPPSTLSRAVITLSRSDLTSASSVHDAASPLEVDVPDHSECGVTATDRLRIEMFYRSFETQVYVCSCLADLFVGALQSRDRWAHVHTGVPVWVLNSGLGRRRRELVLAVAERATGLPLWQDRITYLSNYSQADEGDPNDNASHVLRSSSNLSSAIRVAMFNRRSAAAFLDRFHRFTANPVDDLWKIGDYRRDRVEPAWGWPWCRRRRPGSLGEPVAAAPKDSISQPCYVILVSRTDFRHAGFRAAFAHLLPPPRSPSPPATTSSTPRDGQSPPIAKRENAEVETDAFRPRLPTR